MVCEYCGMEKETKLKKIRSEMINICEDCIRWRERLVKDGLDNNIDYLIKDEG